MAKELTAKRRTDNEIEFGRIVAFSDGVFSIAITLLVLNLGIDKGLTEGQIDNALWNQREDFLAYAISFAVIGRFWLVHHRFFGEVEAFDGRLIGLNLVYLGFIVLPLQQRAAGRVRGEDDRGGLLLGQPGACRPARSAEERRRAASGSDQY